ncbi:MAG: hypothetical protein PHN31_00335 [Candidatus Gracilibacteria bacterium]|nr:hypothetical protein [Candidatus Gracilibacteria bacterium]
MIKKILFFVLFFVSSYIVHADETISINIGNDRIVTQGDTVNLIAEIGGTCSNFNISTIYWQELSDRGDWVTIQSGGTGNLSYSFSAIETKQVRAEIRCPQGVGPLFFSEIISNDIVNITVNLPSSVLVNAGSNKKVSVGTNVNLVGNISGTDASCSIFDYQWSQISGTSVEITNSGQMFVNSKTYNSASFVFPNTKDNLEFKLLVSPQSCADSLYTYSGTVLYGLNSGGGYDYSQRKYEEANYLYSDQKIIDDLNLSLKILREHNYPYLTINWNDLGGKGYVEYFLEYSTGSKFDSFNTLKTKELMHNFFLKDIDQDSFVHYFRVKACYNSKCSGYSNIVKYVSEDYLHITCNKIDLLDFSDIFTGVTTIIDKYYKVICNDCGQKNNK